MNQIYTLTGTDDGLITFMVSVPDTQKVLKDVLFINWLIS